MNILVIAAHADDEVIGCGGTIARCKKEGHTIRVIICTKVGGLRKDRTLATNVIKLSKELSIPYSFLNFEDQGLDVVPQLVLNRALEEKIIKYKPDLVFTHSDYDNNQDHIAVHNSVCVAARNIPNLLFFHIPSLGELKQTPKNAFVKINWQDKKSLLQYYDVEMRNYPHPRSYTNLETDVEEFQVGRITR